MDLASLIGFIGAVGAIIAAMVMGGGVAPFIDSQSIFIVFGGTFFAVMYQNPLPVFLGSFGAMSKAFMPPVKKMDETVERMVELAGMARKDGMMALEGQPVPDKFFEKGMQMLVDGADEQRLVKHGLVGDLQCYVLARGIGYSGDELRYYEHPDWPGTVHGHLRHYQCHYHPLCH